MKTSRMTSTAGRHTRVGAGLCLSLCVGLSSLAAPAAHAGVSPESLWNTADKTYATMAELSAAHGSELATVTKHDIVTVMDSYWERDENGNPKRSASGALLTKLGTKLNWLVYLYNGYRDSKKVQYWTATSPSMGGRKVDLAVITPTGNFDAQRPTIYLLNGAGGADQGMDWLTMTSGETGNTNLIDFYLKKNVNVVVIQDGAFSYYTDWIESPKSGYLKDEKIKWETFLTRELPGVIEGKDYLNSNGKRAIAGMSMSATSALLLAEHNPGFYDAVGSYSGCAATSTPMARVYTELTVNRGGGSVDKMWGPANGEYARYNDALIQTNNLRGSQVYVSTSTGIPGENEMLSSIMERNGGNLSSGFQSSSTLVIEGGTIEAAMHDCTRQLKYKMDSEGIAADWNFRPTGTHSWGGWKQDIWRSWDTYAKAFGQPTGLDVDPAIAASAAASASDRATVQSVSEQAINSEDPGNVPGAGAADTGNPAGTLAEGLATELLGATEVKE